MQDFHIQPFSREINSVPLEEIEWYENGERKVFTQEQYDEWSVIGFSNIDFVDPPNMVSLVLGKMKGSRE